MTDEITHIADVEIEIEYRDFDDYDVESTTVSATIERDDDKAILTAEGIKPRFSKKVGGDRSEDDDVPLTLIVGELRDEVQIYRDDTTTAAVDAEAGTVSVSQLNHDGYYVEAIHSEEFAELLTEMEREAREMFVNDRGIQSVADAGVDVPDVTLTVEERQVAYPSSKTGQNSRPVDKLVAVVDGEEPAEWGAWMDAAVETGVRRDTYGRAFTSTVGSSIDNETLLFAPEGFEAGDTLTLTEWLDATYNVDPVEFAKRGHELAEEAASEREREAVREELVDEHPELDRISFDPAEARDAFDKSFESGEPVAFATDGSECNDPSRECSWDRITYYATPEGGVESKRIHTY